MTIPLDASGFADEDDAHVSNRPKPGNYHVEVVEVDDTFEKVDKVVVEFKVLAGTVPGQEGLQCREYFAVTEKALPRLMMFALAVGVLKPGEKKDVDFTEAVGGQFIVALSENTGKDGKSYINVTYDGMWSLLNPAVADVPRGEGPTMGVDPGVPEGNRSVTTEVPVAADEFGDL